jgi:hypothetical protein
MQSLDTTNVLLAIMAAVSVLEAIVLIALGVAGWKAYNTVMSAVRDLESRHVMPAMQRVHAVLDDVKAVTTTMREETARVDHAINRTLERVDGTARRVRSTVTARTSRFVGILRGVRVAIETILADHPARV